MEIIIIGIGATIVFDLWLVLLKRMGVKTMNMAFIGRWAGHLAQGRFAHDSIAASPAVSGEHALGWLVHYATGVAFAGALVAVAGQGWLHAPSIGPALAVGMATVGAPLFVMQPSMGLGVASSKTPTPLKNCLRSLANHTVFGLGLYLSALLIKGISQ
ncbi:Protein of unknown function [Duganella sp. CF458]|uniref:DUF2938 domain-containing protein n=1 Tax=Duganella sp. CF458 TaxID=1884368 RepID=UPI0008EA839A|nr:DUF2938 domain-containing protein [Duganella sp. CF458]SFG84326.1 Protein of unknown function [Duganella sp. CF458]